MKFKVYITKGFEEMSKVASDIIIGKISDFIPTKEKQYFNIILPTGNSPIGMYDILIKKQGLIDFSNVVSHNLDEYVGLPGETSHERENHLESYSFFMKKYLFERLNKSFYKIFIPKACEIEQKELIEELEKYKGNKCAYYYEGINDGKKGLTIIIPKSSISDYLLLIKEKILDSYTNNIKKYGKVDLCIVGIGEGGHMGFHESGIPLNCDMLLVKLDENTIENAINDGHFISKEKCPKYAVSLGAGFIFNQNHCNEILVLASGRRKARAIEKALYGEYSELIPISGCQKFAEQGKVIFVIDEESASGFINDGEIIKKIKQKGIQIVDLRGQR